jgi:hypothetical protein
MAGKGVRRLAVGMARLVRAMRVRKESTIETSGEERNAAKGRRRRRLPDRDG